MKRIDEELKLKKIPAVKFAEEMGGEDNGYNKSTLYSWKKNKSTSYMNDLQKIADYLGVTTEYLLTGKRVQQEQQYEIYEVEYTSNIKSFLREALQEEELSEEEQKDVAKYIRFIVSNRTISRGGEEQKESSEK